MSLHIAFTHSFGKASVEMEADLGPGVTAFFGPSGAGKSTALNVIAGLLRPKSGRVTFGDRVLFDSASGVHVPPSKRRIGMVFQEARLFPHMTVERNLTYGAPNKDGVPDMAALLGLEGLLTRQPATLSGGEAQRVALGRALLSKPDILLMDEPLSALDQARKEELLPYFERLRDQSNLPIIYVSHAMDEVARLADRMLLMEQGRVIANGPVDRIFAGEGLDQRHSRKLASTIFAAKVTGHAPEDHLTELRFGATPLWIPGVVGTLGQEMRLRIDARDVMLMTTKPEGTSALNILPVTITEIRPGPSTGALVALDHDGSPLMARITKRSVRNLNLQVGDHVFAMVKSMSVARDG